METGYHHCNGTDYRKNMVLARLSFNRNKNKHTFQGSGNMATSERVMLRAQGQIFPNPLNSFTSTLTHAPPVRRANFDGTACFACRYRPCGGGESTVPTQTLLYSTPTRVTKRKVSYKNAYGLRKNEIKYVHVFSSLSDLTHPRPVSPKPCNHTTSAVF